MTALPLTDLEFSRLMEPFGPFETAPFLAAGVSGGADSLALALLADRWVRARGGYLAALTVDHGLRAESAAEARQVAEWLAARGIAHTILTWDGPRPSANLQDAARAARYALLESWCRAHGCLHLLTAHHLQDQAETVLLRLARGSGVDGLAAMPALRETGACRLLRPLLAVPHERLSAVLALAGQRWIEDPSNRNRGFARVRLRQAAAALALEGLGPRRLGDTARRLGRARAALEDGVARCLAGAVELHPAGFARLDAGSLLGFPEEVGLRALGQLLATLGGAAHTPRLERLERLYRWIGAGAPGRGRTLSGCRLAPRRGHAKADHLLVFRELALIAPAIALVPGESRLWDGRFRLSLAPEAPSGLRLGALGPRTKAGLPGMAPLQDGEGHDGTIPNLVQPTLPAIRDLFGTLHVPHLCYMRPESGWEAVFFSCAFRPARPLTKVGFTVV